MGLVGRQSQEERQGGRAPVGEGQLPRSQGPQLLTSSRSHYPGPGQLPPFQGWATSGPVGGKGSQVQHAL